MTDSLPSFWLSAKFIILFYIFIKNLGYIIFKLTYNTMDAQKSQKAVIKE